MIVKWEPEWYALDQSIVVGDIDFFYLTKDNQSFCSDLLGENDCEVKAEIVSIKHLELGNIKGIVVVGLDYFVYLCDGQEIVVNAEEYPGEIVNSERVVKDWSCEVQINIFERTGLSSMERSDMMNGPETRAWKKERFERYKTLLNLTQADWD